MSRTKRKINKKWLPVSGIGERERQMLDRVLAGETLVDVAEKWGLTRERVRQIVTAMDRNATAKGRAVRAERVRQQRQLARNEELAANPNCAICWGPILRKRVGPTGGRYPTCSPRCARLREVAQYHLFPDMKLNHKRTMARWHLNNPVRSTGAELAYSLRVLAGTTKPRKQRAVTAERVQIALDEIERLRAKNRREDPED